MDRISCYTHQKVLSTIAIIIIYKTSTTKDIDNKKRKIKRKEGITSVLLAMLPTTKAAVVNIDY